MAALIAAEVDPAVEGPVIELGPGTGAVTDSLIARGISPSRLVLVESHPDFCALLEERYPEARIVSGDAYALDTCLTPLHLAPAAALISGLPMLSKPREARVALLRQAFLHLRPGAPFIQFTYAPTSPIPLTTPGVLARVSPRIWRNFPPAQVWTYREVPLLA